MQLLTLKITIMKTLSFFLLVVIFVFAGCSKNDDILLQTNDDLQLKSAEKGAGYTEQFYFSPAYEDYYLEVICDGETVDVLHGDGESLTVHGIIHYKNGEMQWGKWLVKGSLTSESTGVTFTIHEQNRGMFDKEDDFYYLITRTNAIGDDGTHYLFSAKFIWPVDEYEGIVWENGTWEDLRAKCVPDKK
jgi:hypothetical protein